MLYIENTTKDLLERVPEPDLIMDNSKSVEAFDQQGSPGGALIPIYKYCARAISKRIPKNGTLLDLGSGSGQFLIYLAHKRPDISITGIDLSDAMVERGNYNIEKNNLSHQITLKVADMTSFSQHVDKNLNLITTN